MQLNQSRSIDALSVLGARFNLGSGKNKQLANVQRRDAVYEQRTFMKFSKKKDNNKFFAKLIGSFSTRTT